MSRNIVLCGLIGLLVTTVVVTAQEDPWDAAQLDATALGVARAEARALVTELKDATTNEQFGLRGAAEARVALLDQLLRTLEDGTSLLGLAEIERRRQDAGAAFERLKTESAPPIVARTPAELAPYEQEFREAEAEHKTRKDALDQLFARRKSAEEESGQLPGREAEAKQKLEAVREAIADPVAIARAGNLRLELRLLQERGRFLRTALERWVIRVQMQQAELDVSRVRLENAQERLTRARTAVGKALATQAKEEKARAESDAKEAEHEKDPLDRFRKSVQAEIDRLRADAKQDQATSAALDQRLDTEKAIAGRLDEELVRLKDRLNVREGMSERTARLLQKSLARTEKRRVALRRTTLPKLDLQLSEYLGLLGDVQDRRWELDEPLEDQTDWQRLNSEVAPDRRVAARQLYLDAYSGKDGLAAALRERQASLEDVYARLGRLEKHYGEQLRALERMSTFVGTHVYLLRSDPPISLNSFRQAGHELHQLGSMYASRESWDGVQAAYRQARLTFVGVCCGSLAVLLLAFFLARKGGAFRKAVGTRKLGAKAVGIQVLMALLVPACIPAAIVLVCVLLGVLGLPDVLARPVARLLPPLAVLLFVRGVIWRFLGRDGIAVSEFRMPGDVASQLLRSIRVATTGGLLFYVPYLALTGPPFALVWIPRLLFTAFEASVLAAFMLLARRKGAFVRACTGGTGKIYRAWAIVGPLVTVGLFAILLMDVLGYRFGATRLLWSVAQTFVAVILLVGLYRVLQGTAEKIAYAVRRRTVLQEGQDEDAAWESSKRVLRQLTRVGSVGVIVLAVLLLASFWDLDDRIQELLGGIHLTEVGDGDFLTLWNVLIAMLWIAAGHFVVFNLSGIYEFLVLPLIGTAERGGQYVFLALSRYLILLVSYSAAVITLKFSFSSLGWLLAAASVGLGFGLQEIIANFVSGLILLVERPVRVGDIITVGDTGGTVEKINIRATAVTNWDRQQIIIPNKEFITQRLTNWTRNDEFVRRKVVVGVAYRSDVAQVLHVLREIVANHAKVRKDPLPRIWFEEFGESTLNFEIWFFAPVWEGKEAQSELREEIHRRFRTEGIEIAFPQRDLHIRSIEEAEPTAE